MVDQETKEANVIAGDAILNYRTVIAFGTAERIVSEYDRLLEGPVQVTIKKARQIALLYGFSRFIEDGVYGLLFFAAAQMIDRGVEMEPFTTLIAVWCVMEGVKQFA
jgi:ABC-type transport system involved in Fe-S cluster assembly fused permease/ATPase subunit